MAVEDLTADEATADGAVDASAPDASAPDAATADGSPAGTRRVDPAWVVGGIVVALCVVAGVVLRYRYYTVVDPSPDSDEAEMGLLALELTRGEWPLLMRNQPYGGTIWLWPMAASLRLLGVNAVGLRSTVVLLGLVNAGLVAAIARSLGWTRLRSALAAAAVWCYPIAAVSFTSRETGYFVPAVTGGLLALLLVLRAERRRESLTDPMATTQRSVALLGLAGFVAGVAFWTNPGSFYLTVPTFGWLFLRALRTATVAEGWRARVWDVVRPMGLTAIGFIAGALPWWFITVFGPSRRDNYEGRPVTSPVDRVEFFGKEILPGWFGFREPFGSDFHGEWLGGAAWQVGFVALFALVVFQVARRKRLREESVVTVAALTVLPMYLIVTAQAGEIYTNLRYIMFASPILVLVVAAKWRRDLAAALAVGVLPLVSLAASQAWQPTPYYTIEPVIDVLEERGTACVLGDYWAGGHRLMFATEERIIAVPTYENRNPKYPDLAEDLGNCAWLYRDGQPSAAAFERWLQAEGIGFEVQRPAPLYVVFFPERRVWLDEVPAEALN